MTTVPVYIAAPYQAPTSWLIEWNVQRATLLAALALHNGLAPVLTHCTGWQMQLPETPEVRDRVLPWGLLLLDMVAYTPGARLWVLDGHRPSTGVIAEVERWRNHHPGSVERGDWAQWGHSILQTGNELMISRHRELMARPEETLF